MKKLLAIFLAALQAFGLCACAGAASDTKSLRVGYARENVTPSYSIPLAGYGNTLTRMSTGFANYLYVTCVAVTDANDQTVLLFSCDLIGFADYYAAELRTAISAATGVPSENIMLACTHTHSGPDCYTSDPSSAKYRTEYTQKAVKAAQAAMADRSAATIETGFGKTERLNFVRHYTTSAGELYGDNLVLHGQITGHTHDADNEIQLICFRRADEGKKDVLAVNWQAHPKLDSTANTAEGKSNRKLLSSDYVGATRDFIEANTDCLFVFYQGAAGNLNADSYIKAENFATDCKTYSEALGGHILDGMKTMKAVEGDDHKITLTRTMYTATYDHSEDHKVEDATKIREIWTSTNNWDQAMAAAPDAGIESPYHAGAIISRSKKTEPTLALELNAIRIGPLAFVTAPDELFDVTAVAVKEGSPFDTTFVMTCTNGLHNYIAAEYAFQGRGVYEVHNRSFVQGTAEELADNFLEMLNTLAQ